MDKTTGFVICIESTDAYMYIGSMHTNKLITNSLITSVIRGVLTENNQTEYSASDIEEIVVLIGCDTFEMLYSLKIEDVWPSEFGPKNETRNYKKGDEKN